MAPYGNSPYTHGTHFKKTKFFHIIHNVEKGYDGELFFDDVPETLAATGIPQHVIQNSENSINLSK